MKTCLLALVLVTAAVAGLMFGLMGLMFAAWGALVGVVVAILSVFIAAIAVAFAVLLALAPLWLPVLAIVALVALCKRAG